MERSGYMQDTEAASILGLKPNTLRKWRVLGRGPRYRKLGRAVRYSKADLDAWLSTCPGGGEPSGEQPALASLPGQQ
ncbi:MAG: helix-turn-helix domain-containing protein [Acidobacteriia bacterium]|nr:helix-turn-helix domain-containing protein [Terriglobia bacterium]